MRSRVGFADAVGSLDDEGFTGIDVEMQGAEDGDCVARVGQGMCSR